MKPVLIIDPGHGGRDPGGGSNKYWKEKAMALKISQYQYQRFNELGIETVLTRNVDVEIKSNPRARIVRDSGAKYCLSNHINAGGGQGAEFIHSIHANGELEDKMANELKKAGQNIRRVFTRCLPSDPSKDYYYMHRTTGAVNTTIAEYGFADNAKDTERLKCHWKEYAEAVVKAFTLHQGYKYTQPNQKPSKWAENSWAWAKKIGITDGSDPKGQATREMVIEMIYRAVEGDK